MPFKRPLTLVRNLFVPLESLSLLVFACIDCGWIFAQHFCNRLGAAYIGLKNVLDEGNPDHAEVLNNIKRRFREETFTREGIAEVIREHPELVSFRHAG